MRVALLGARFVFDKLVTFGTRLEPDFVFDNLVFDVHIFFDVHRTGVRSKSTFLRREFIDYKTSMITD